MLRCEHLKKEVLKMSFSMVEGAALTNTMEKSWCQEVDVM